MHDPHGRARSAPALCDEHRLDLMQWGLPMPPEYSASEWWRTRHTADLKSNAPLRPDAEVYGVTCDQIDDFLEGKRIGAMARARILQFYSGRDRGAVPWRPRNIAKQAVDTLKWSTMVPDAERAREGLERRKLVEQAAWATPGVTMVSDQLAVG